jgi:hypothetical protein
LNTNIPLLKPVDFDFREIFIVNLSNGIDEYFDVVMKKYPHAILDVFEHTLDKSDPRIELLSNEYFRLSQEYKYLNFIEEVFSLNDKKCYIDIVFEKNSCLSFKRELCKLDEIDKYILLHQLISFSNANHKKNYLIDDVNLAKMFIRGMLREYWQYSLYFDKNPLILFGNYDLSLPIVCKNENDMKTYEKIANKHGLYFRYIER